MDSETWSRVKEFYSSGTEAEHGRSELDEERSAALTWWNKRTRMAGTRTIFSLRRQEYSLRGCGNVPIVISR